MIREAGEVRTVSAVDASTLHLHPQPPPGIRGREPRISVVIPTLNEAANVVPVLQGLPRCVTEIIVVDGRSEDGTAEVALAADQRVRLVLERRRGKGAAMLSGFAAAQEDAIVVLDADGSMDPRDVIAFQATLGLGYDLVKGSREAVGGGSTDFTPLRHAGNTALTRLANVVHHTHWTDMCYGYFGFWRDVLPRLEIGSDRLTTRALAYELALEARRGVKSPNTKLVYGHGFEIETALFLRAARAGCDIAEIPSRELPRLTGESNLRTFRDGARVLSAIAREWSRRRTRATAA